MRAVVVVWWNVWWFKMSVRRTVVRVRFTCVSAQQETVFSGGIRGSVHVLTADGSFILQRRSCRPRAPLFFALYDDPRRARLSYSFPPSLSPIRRDASRPASSPIDVTPIENGPFVYRDRLDSPLRSTVRTNLLGHFENDPCIRVPPRSNEQRGTRVRGGASFEKPS